MKKIILFLAILLLIAFCQEDQVQDDAQDVADQFDQDGDQEVQQQQEQEAAQEDNQQQEQQNEVQQTNNEQENEQNNQQSNQNNQQNNQDNQQDNAQKQNTNQNNKTKPQQNSQKPKAQNNYQKPANNTVNQNRAPNNSTNQNRASNNSTNQNRAATNSTKSKGKATNSTADEEDDRQNLMQEWEKYMADFVPDEMLTFTVESKTEEVFLEEITQPTNIRGAYFVSYYTNEKVDFYIKNPLSKVIFRKVDKREGIFSVEAQEIGQYQFVFSNRKGKDSKAITFALDVRNVTETHLKDEDLDPVEKRLEVIATGIKDYLTEQKFSSKRQQSQLESINSTNRRLLTFSVVEIILVILANAWQIYYIKKILDNKRIV